MDSLSQSGWHFNTQNIGKVAKIESIGYVVKNDPEFLTLTTSIGNYGGALDVVSIPWVCIVDVDRLGAKWDRV